MTIPTIVSLSYFNYAVSACVGGLFALAGLTDLGTLASYLVYVRQSAMPMNQFTQQINFLLAALSGAERIFEILDTESKISDADGVTKLPPVKGAVTFDHVSFSYDGEKRVLDDVSFQIKPGETIALVGPTGAGKTTIVNLISRFYDIQTGHILIDDYDVQKISIESLRQQMGVMTQDNFLFSGTIKENLRWGDENASDEELERVCRLAQADEFIQQMPDKYDTHIEQGGSNVSGGQKQRLCIARALLKKPKILILDDSTSAVDTKTDALIRKAFAEEIPDTTKIIIAQRVSSVQDADQIVILDGGTVQAVGTHDELLAANTIYQEIYNQQNRKGGEE